MTYELQINGRFEYVKASSEAKAIVKLKATLSACERHWANIIPTGRNR